MLRIEKKENQEMKRPRSEDKITNIDKEKQIITIRTVLDKINRNRITEIDYYFENKNMNMLEIKDASRLISLCDLFAKVVDKRVIKK